MVSRFHGDDVGTEVRTKEQAEGANLVGPLGFPARERELSELLIRSQHHHLGAKHNSGLLIFIIINLYRGIVGDPERDDLIFVTL